MPPSCALLAGFAVGARVTLLWQHYGNAWQSPAVIRQAHRMQHAARTTHACDAPAACAVPFRPYCGGVVTRTQNVSEYMLVLALCLVISSIVIIIISIIIIIVRSGPNKATALVCVCMSE